MKKLFISFGTVIYIFMAVFATSVFASQPSPSPSPQTQTQTAPGGKNIYGDKTGIEAVDKASSTVLSVVAGVGMTAFTVAFLVIALCLGFMSLSPQASSRLWKALFICLAAALIFFSAYMIPGSIKNLA